MSESTAAGASMQSQRTPASWPAPVAAGPVIGRVSVPGSKSITNRALLLAAISDGPSTVTNVLAARDTSLMIGALESLGATFANVGQSRMHITPISKGRQIGSVAIDCGLAGTVMRFVPAITGLVAGSVTLDGDAAARRRPMTALISALQQAGIAITSKGECLPITIEATGAFAGGNISIDASTSSQFVSALLLAGATYDSGITLTHTGTTLPSLPHIEMSIAMLREHGVAVIESRTDQWQWVVAPSAIGAINRTIEPDLSNALPFIAASVVTAGSTTVNDWPTQTTQPGQLALPILEAMGCTLALAPADGAHQLTVTGPERIHSVDVDMSAMGELVPTIAAMCFFADGPSRLRGISHIRGHETDRIAALIDIAERIGAVCRDVDGDLVIEPLHHTQLRAAADGPTVTIPTYDDHRLATAGAIIGLRRAHVLVENIATTGKTMPDFPAMWESLVSAR